MQNIQKIKEFQDILRRKGIDFFISCNIDFSRFDYDIAYFSGYNGVGVMIIPARKKPFIIVARMEKKRIRKKGLKVYCPGKGKRLSDSTEEILKRNKIRNKRIGLNKEGFTLLLKDIFKKSLRGARFIDLRKGLAQLREQKTKEEIEIIKKGCRISDEIMKRCFRQFRRFKKEGEVKAFLEYEAKKKGCELTFPTIVASGSNSAIVHHNTEDARLKKGFCVIDFGIRYRNYCTDTTRTVYLGKPSKKEIKLYNLLLDVQEKAIKNVKIGKKYAGIVRKVNKELGNYSKYFTHGLGHGFGIKIHEAPDLTEKSNHKIKDNSVFTIEPGIYLKRYGIRIEDDILVSKRKVEILTKADKKLLIIP